MAKTTKSSDKKSSKKEDDTKIFAFLAVFLSIIGVIIAYTVRKDNKFVIFYAKQSLVLFICFVIARALMFIPGLNIIFMILNLSLFILWIFGLIYSLSGEMKEIPLIGQFASKFNF